MKIGLGDPLTTAVGAAQATTASSSYGCDSSFAAIYPWCWPSTPTDGCYGGGAAINTAACASANTAGANALCVSNPATCANYTAVTGNNPDGTPGAGTNWCYLIGLCDVNGNPNATFSIMLLVGAFVVFELLERR